MLSENHTARDASTAHKRPSVTVTLEEPRPPRFPSLARGKAALRYLFLTIAALWVFGGMLFFFLRFSCRFYYANEQAF